MSAFTPLWNIQWICSTQHHVSRAMCSAGSVLYRVKNFYGWTVHSKHNVKYLNWCSKAYFMHHKPRIKYSFLPVFFIHLLLFRLQAISLWVCGKVPLRDSIVNTNTCTTSMSLIKIYLKFHKNTPTCFGHTDHHQGVL